MTGEDKKSLAEDMKNRIVEAMNNIENFDEDEVCKVLGNKFEEELRTIYNKMDDLNSVIERRLKAGFEDDDEENEDEE